MCLQHLYKKYLVIIWIFLVTVNLLAKPCTALSKERKDDTEAAKNFKSTTDSITDTIIITSGSLIADTKQNIVTFIGTVKVVKGDMILLADKMAVKYTPENGKVRDIEATGNIKLSKGNNIINSDTANYDAIEEKIVFLGNLKAEVGKNRITGTKITFYINNERSIVENSSVHIIN